MKKGVISLVLALVLGGVLSLNTMAATISMEVLPTDNDSVVRLDIILDEIPSDIEKISAITIRYCFDNTKLEYVKTEANEQIMKPQAADADSKNPGSGSIIWYDSSYDGSKAITSEMLISGGNRLCTLEFKKLDKVRGSADFTFSFLEFAAFDFSVTKELTSQNISVPVLRVVTVTDAIDSIGDAVYTFECKKAIDEAYSLYHELTEDKKLWVTNFSELESAKEAYHAMEMAVKEVNYAIESIGTVEYTPECLTRIVNAENLYNALDETLRKHTDAQTLNDARASYDAMDKVVKEVNYAIESIGTVEYTPECLACIENAENLYNALDETLRKHTDAQTLTDARASYNAMDKSVKEVNDAIESIGTVEYTPECLACIENAENLYNTLDELLRKHTDAQTLADARASYNAMEKSVKEVNDAIESIGTVEYTPECLSCIENAENLYNALDELLRKHTDAQTLTDARASYDAMNNAIRAVKDAIGAIGTVEYTKECRGRIQLAEKLYNELNDILKPHVINYSELQNAVNEYSDICPKVYRQNNIAGYNNNHMAVVSNIASGKTVKLNGIEAHRISIGDKSWHMIITPLNTDTDWIEVIDGTPHEQIAGSVINNKASAITANDAQMIAKYAHGLTMGVFGEDPMSFVRADIDGSGTITADDALATAIMASGQKVENKIYIGIDNAE